MNWRRPVAVSVALLSSARCGSKAAPSAPTESPTPETSTSPNSWDREFDSGAALDRIALAQSGLDEIARHWQLRHGRTPDSAAEERFVSLLPGRPPMLTDLAREPANDGKYDVYLDFSDWVLVAASQHAITDDEYRAGWKLSKGSGIDPVEIVETASVPDLVRRWIDGVAAPLDRALAAFELPIPYVDFKVHRERWTDALLGRVSDPSSALRCRAAIACVDRHAEPAIAILTSYLGVLARLPVVPRAGDLDGLVEEEHGTLRLLTAIVRTGGSAEASRPRLQAVIDGDSAAAVRRGAVEFIRWNWLGAILGHSMLIDDVLSHREIPGGFASMLESMRLRLEARDRQQLLLAEDELWQAIHSAFVEESDWPRAFERATRSIASLVREESGSKPADSGTSSFRARQLAAALWFDKLRRNLEDIDKIFLSGSLQSFQDRCNLSAATEFARNESASPPADSNVDTPRSKSLIDPVFGLPAVFEFDRNHQVAAISIDRQLLEQKRLREKLSQDLGRIQEALRAAYPTRH